MSLRVVARPAVGARCGFCRDAIDAAALTCSDCGAMVHAACQPELPACPTLGCSSLAPWEWTPEPASPVRARGRRAWRTVALLATAVPLVWLGTSVTSTRSEAPGATEVPSRSAWAVLGRGAELDSRTETKVPARVFSCTRREPCVVEEWDGPRSERDEDTCAQALPTLIILCEREGPCVVGWIEPRVSSVVERRHRVLWELDDLVRVEVHASDAANVTRPERPAVPRFALTPDPPGEPATVTVPAGTFACTYRQEPGTTDLGLPCTIETWTVPGSPCP